MHPSGILLFWVALVFILHLKYILNVNLLTFNLAFAYKTANWVYAVHTNAFLYMEA